MAAPEFAPRCRHCGGSLSDSARFCGQCGKPRGEPSAALAQLRLWRRLSPALGLWVALLGLNLVIGLWVGAVGTWTKIHDVVVAGIEAVLVLLAVVSARAELGSSLSVRGFRARDAWLTLAVLLALAAFMTAYFAGLAGIGGETLSMLEDFEAAEWPLWSAFLLVAVVPGVLEELAFRGFIQSRLGEVMRPGEALVVQAAMFSILHLLPLIFLSHFVMGLALGYLRKRTGKLLPGMLVHMAWNAWVVAQEAWFHP